MRTQPLLPLLPLPPARLLRQPVSPHPQLCQCAAASPLRQLCQVRRGAASIVSNATPHHLAGLELVNSFNRSRHTPGPAGRGHVPWACMGRCRVVPQPVDEPCCSRAWMAPGTSLTLLAAANRRARSTSALHVCRPAPVLQTCGSSRNRARVPGAIPLNPYCTLPVNINCSKVQRCRRSASSRALLLVPKSLRLGSILLF